jgi:hypothetical protein
MASIEIKPHRRGWKRFEARGVEPVFPTKDQAIDYAQNRACFRSGEVRIFDSTGNDMTLLGFFLTPLSLFLPFLLITSTSIIPAIIRVTPIILRALPALIFRYSYHFVVASVESKSGRNDLIRKRIGSACRFAIACKVHAILALSLNPLRKGD